MGHQLKCFWYLIKKIDACSFDFLLLPWFWSLAGGYCLLLKCFLSWKTDEKSFCFVLFLSWISFYFGNQQMMGPIYFLSVLLKFLNNFFSLFSPYLYFILCRYQNLQHSVWKSACNILPENLLTKIHYFIKFILYFTKYVRWHFC